MTKNQIDYLKVITEDAWRRRTAQETERANLVNEELTRRRDEGTLDVRNRELLETNRSNLAKEYETNRSNVARERETHRSNLAQEQLKLQSNQIQRDTLNETIRHNQIGEAETYRSNVARETENFRSHQATEAETYRSNLARELENNRSNMAREFENTRHNSVMEQETYRSNVARENETHRSNVAREQETYRSNRASESIGRSQVSLGYSQLAEARRHNSEVESNQRLASWYDYNVRSQKNENDMLNSRLDREARREVVGVQETNANKRTLATGYVNLANGAMRAFSSIVGNVLR